MDTMMLQSNTALTLRSPANPTVSIMSHTASLKPHSKKKPKKAFSPSELTKLTQTLSHSQGKLCMRWCNFIYCFKILSSLISHVWQKDEGRRVHLPFMRISQMHTKKHLWHAVLFKTPIVFLMQSRHRANMILN